MVGWVNKLNKWTNCGNSHSVEYYSAVKKEENADMRDNIDESQMHYAKWHMPGSKDQTVYNSTQMEF